MVSKQYRVYAERTTKEETGDTGKNKVKNNVRAMLYTSGRKRVQRCRWRRSKVKYEGWVEE